MQNPVQNQTQTCWARMLETKLRAAGLRPTRQRVALANTIFRHGDRHLTAEQLHDEVSASGFNVSLATVYNTLHQFTSAGLLRMLAVEGAKGYFDTNTSDHHHFFVEGENTIIDVPNGPIAVGNLPSPPEGMEIVNIDVIIRLRPARC